jgi:hypothetical protein
VRLALELTGPLRPEFNMINSIVQKYANSVDGTIDSVQNAVSEAWQRPSHPPLLSPLIKCLVTLLV